MSRSNPSVNAPNPAVRWFEWNGEKGVVRYYDKDAKQNVDVALPFTFLLLDELASVRGWHEPSKSGIYSNEIRDTTKDVLVVKSFKGGTLAEGYYKQIKAEVNAEGGHFNANCYIAFKQGDQLLLGSIRFKGAALGAWMDFRKAHRADLFSQAIEISTYTEGKKGRVTFRVPVFAVRPTSETTNKQAMALDKALQAYLEGYFSRRTSDQTEAIEPAAAVAEEPVDDPESWPQGDELTVDDIPF